jgi:transcriptional regulator with XRE-family HTH domain
VISLGTWAEIRYLYGSEGLSQRAIARQLGVSRDTVARAIASRAPPKYERVSGPSAFDPFEPLVRELLCRFPTMPTSVVAERVGWPGSQSWFRKKVALLRPEYAPKDPADRLSHRPGEQAQCDLWFPPVRVPLGDSQVDSPPVLVPVSSFSRFITAAMIPSRQTPDLVAGMWSLLAGQLGAVPRRLLWDNKTGIGRRRRGLQRVAPDQPGSVALTERGVLGHDRAGLRLGRVRPRALILVDQNQVLRHDWTPVPFDARPVHRTAHYRRAALAPIDIGAGLIQVADAVDPGECRASVVVRASPVGRTSDPQSRRRQRGFYR